MGEGQKKYEKKEKEYVGNHQVMGTVEVCCTLAITVVITSSDSLRAIKRNNNWFLQLDRVRRREPHHPRFTSSARSL